MDLDFLPPHTAATILAVLAAASALLPVLEAIAAKTSNTWDNKALAVVRDVLALIPRISVSPAAPGMPDAPVKFGATPSDGSVVKLVVTPDNEEKK